MAADGLIRQQFMHRLYVEHQGWLMTAYIFVFGFSRSMQFTAINALTYADVNKSRQSSSVALGGCMQQITMAWASRSRQC